MLFETLSQNLTHISFLSVSFLSLSLSFSMAFHSLSIVCLYAVSISKIFLYISGSFF